MNWLLTIIGSFVGSIILAILGNLLTDVYKNAIGKLSLQSRKKRLTTLTRELEQITALHADHNKVLVEALISILLVQLTFMIGLAAGIVALAIYTMLQIQEAFTPWMNTMYYLLGTLAVLAGASLIYAAITIGLRSVAKLTKVSKFEDYKAETEKKLQAMASLEE